VLALVLSGGGIYGAAHVGVLAALQELGIRPDVVVGTSAGSLVGGVYAAGHPVETLLKLTRELSPRDVPLDWKSILAAIVRRRHLPDRVLNPDPLLRKAEGLIGGATVRSTRIPCYITATSLTARRVVVFGPPLSVDPFSEDALKLVPWPEDVPLLTAMAASTAVPGLFRPVRLQGHWLVDGGVLDDYPLDVAVLAGATRVIGVYIDDRGGRLDERESPHIITTAGSSLNLLLNDSTWVRRHFVAERFGIPRVEVPIPVAGLSLTDFHQIPKLIELGLSETLRLSEPLRKLAAA
jgi:NTE family protein